MKPNGVLVLKKIQILCQKSPGKSTYPELMYKRYCLYPQGYTVHHHLCLIECVSLPLEAIKGFLESRNLIRFHYTWPKAINSTDIKALWAAATLKGLGEFQNKVLDHFLPISLSKKCQFQDSRF